MDDQRAAVEALVHDGVLSAEIFAWEDVGLPAKTLVCIGEVLCVCVCVCACMCACVCAFRIKEENS